MTGKLTNEVRIGKSVYKPGTRVQINPLYSNMRDECYWIVFPGGDGTYLNTKEVEPC